MSKLAIPYVTKFSKNITVQLSYEKTFELLINDINTALEYLKSAPEYPDEKRPDNYYEDANADNYFAENTRHLRMNYYAALALKARVYSWMGGEENMAKAANAAQEVINERFPSSYPKKTAEDPNPVIPEDFDYIFALSIPNFSFIYGHIIDVDDLSDVNSDEMYYSKTFIEEMYETSDSEIGSVDLRYIKYIKPITIGKVCRKLTFTISENYEVMPIIRLPEMYYIIAEYNATKTTPETNLAAQNLNTVRDARGILKSVPEDLAPIEIQEEILKEYRKEYIFEGHLFYYFKRLGMKTFPGLDASIEANDKIYILPYPSDEIEFGQRVQF
jgi:hypothetical protein